jgi:hypothetical protein
MTKRRGCRWQSGHLQDVQTAPKWTSRSKVDIQKGSEDEYGHQGCQNRVADVRSMSTFARLGAENVHLRVFGEACVGR